MAKNIGWPIYLEEELKRIRKRKILIDEENKNPDDNQKTIFRREVFNIFLDNVIRDMTDELQSLKCIYLASFGEKTLLLLNLLNAIKILKLENVFPYLTVALWIFITIPATVASAKLSFSVPKRVKNVLRATISQDRLSSLRVLAVEHELAKNTNLDGVIDDFASKKARKGTPLV